MPLQIEALEEKDDIAASKTSVDPKEDKSKDNDDDDNKPLKPRDSLRRKGSKSRKSNARLVNTEHKEHDGHTESLKEDLDKSSKVSSSPNQERNDDQTGNNGLNDCDARGEELVEAGKKSKRDLSSRRFKSTIDPDCDPHSGLAEQNVQLLRELAAAKEQLEAEKRLRMEAEAKVTDPIGTF